MSNFLDRMVPVLDSDNTSSPRTPTPAEQMLKAEQRHRWETDRAILRSRHPFTGSLAATLALIPVVDSRLPTMMTDGRHLFANAHFSAGLTPDVRRFLIAHAVAHCVGGHFLSVEHRDPGRWNPACEHVANYLALLDGISLPAGAVLYPAQAGQGLMQVYTWLADHPWPAFDRHLDMHPLDKRMETVCATVIDPDYRPVSQDPALAHQWHELALAQAGTLRQTALRDYLDVVVFPHR